MADSQIVGMSIPDCIPKRDRAGFALALCVQALDMLAENALTPSEKRIASTRADMARPYIPRHIQTQFDIVSARINAQTRIEATP